MMLVGFGGLMQFLSKYGYSAIGFTFFLTCLSVQWGIIMVALWRGVFSGDGTSPQLSMEWLFQVHIDCDVVGVVRGMVVVVVEAVVEVSVAFVVRLISQS